MLAAKQRAAVQPTAQNQNQLNQAYDHSHDKSNKILGQTAALLLYLQTSLTRGERAKCWSAFESKLRQYVDLKRCGRAI